jgi:lipopolysaccharide/colanic/teichoic acid biosynthesis glycosyltransferase
VSSPDRLLPFLSPLHVDNEKIGTVPLGDLRLRPADGRLVLPGPQRLGRSVPRQIVVHDDVVTDRLLADRLAQLAYSGVQVRRARDHYEQRQRRVLLEAVDEAWFLFDRPLRARRAYSAVKRGTDLVAAVLGSLLVVLLVPVLWLLVRVEDGGPLFYRQERIGRGGVPFSIWKFRSMRSDAEADGPRYAGATDDRVTGVGRVLRRTRLDELPQFFNVLQGHMSLVGPRPERPVFVRTLGRAIPFYDRRHLMRPGITGWATVRFGYGDSVNDKWHSHEYDLYYLKHRSLLLDAEILLRTLVVMTLRRGQ